MFKEHSRPDLELDSASNDLRSASRSDCVATAQRGVRGQRDDSEHRRDTRPRGYTETRNRMVVELVVGLQAEATSDHLDSLRTLLLSWPGSHALDQTNVEWSYAFWVPPSTG